VGDVSSAAVRLLPPGSLNLLPLAIVKEAVASDKIAFTGK